jgi:DNA-directed RNA polymerase specialized sigma subunit
MNAKEYLSQARFLDARINAKIKQLDGLNTLATNATSVLSGMPHSPNRGTSKLETIIVKIVDLQEEINHDIDELVDLKRAIVTLIKQIPSDEQQAVLEKRYLNYQPWEQISVDMGYSSQHIFRIHNDALEVCDRLLKR